MPTNAINDTGVKYLYDKLHGEIEPVAEAVSDSEVTIEGNPLNFNTLSAQNAKSTILSLEPIQDLHGYDKPWVGGAGKNLIPMTVEGIKASNVDGTWNGNAYTMNGVTFTLNTDSDGNIISISTSGTSDSTSNTFIYVAPTNALNISDNTNIILTGCPDGGSWGTSKTYALRCVNSSWDWAANDTGSGATISYQSSYIRFYIDIGQNVNMNNKTFYPMIRLATEPNPIFEPYTNICSISGLDKIGILGCGKNLFDNENTSENYVISNTDGTLIPNNYYGTTDYIRISPNTLYSVSGNTNNPGGAIAIGEYDEYKNFVNYLEKTQRNDNTIYGTFTTNNDSHFIRISLVKNSGLVQFNTLQLEQNNQVTQYTAYQSSNDLTISLGQTVFGGTLDVENGVLVVDKELFSVSGTDINSVNTESNMLRVFLSSRKYTITSAYPNNAISDKYVAGTSYSDVNNNNGRFALNDTTNGSVLLIRDDSQTSTSLITYLTSSPLQICYELETPTTIQLTPQQVQLLKGINNISTTGTSITVTFKNGSVATLADVKALGDNLTQEIADSQILTDTVTGDKYKLVVTSGVLSIEQISN